MFTFLTRLGRLFVGVIVVVGVTGLFGFRALTTVPVAATHKAPACAVTPTSVSLNQSFSVNAVGLPTGSPVNLIRKYPNGTTETMPISIASGGTYSLTQSSADSVLPSQQTGAYNYTFVGKVKWPQGTYSQTYASCSVSVG